jgi:sugar diacid utilization regulator/predicted hydrocarbon binding protein
MDFDLPINLKDLLNIDHKNGLLYVNDERYVLLPSSSFGILQSDLIENIGIERVKTFFFRHGWNIGQEDAKVVMKDSSMSLMERISFLPVFHSVKGHVKATITEKVLEMEDGQVKKYRFKGIWENSFEAEQHIQRLGKADHPICHSLVGYASGANSYLLGETVLFKEHQCIGEGAPYCIWEGRLLSDWEDEVREEFIHNKELPILKELEHTYEKLLHEKNNLSTIMNVDHKLTDGIIKGHDVETILKIVESQIMRPVVIEDLYHQVVLLQGITKDEYEPINNEFQCFLKNSGAIKRIIKIQHSNCTRLVSPIYLQGKIVAYCSFLYKGINRCNFNVDSMIINRVSTLWSLVLLNDKVKLESTERMKGYFFEEILNGRIHSEQELMKKAFFIDLDFTGGYYAIHLKYIISDNQNNLNPNLQIEIFECVSKYMSDKGIHVLVGQKADSLFIILPQKQLGKKIVEHVIYPFMSFLRKALIDTEWFAGISLMHNKVLEEVKEAFKEAHTAVKLSTKGSPVTFFYELGILGVLINEDNKLAIRKIAQLALGDLYINLDQSKVELIKTLYIFLTNGGNFEQTSEQLSISVNGVRYRLNKITNLIGNDFRDPERSFQLLLSLKALILLEDESLKIQMA